LRIEIPERISVVGGRITVYQVLNYESILGPWEAEI
jgi:hypothetical protein